MKAHRLLALTLAVYLFRMHYVSPSGIGHEIELPASCADDACITVGQMFPASYVDGVWRVNPS